MSTYVITTNEYRGGMSSQGSFTAGYAESVEFDPITLIVIAETTRDPVVLLREFKNRSSGSVRMFEVVKEIKDNE